MITAKEILESEVFKAALERIEERLVDSWRMTDPENEKDLRVLSHRQQALFSIVDELRRELHKQSPNLKGRQK